jgi:hypothetical protein
VLIIFTPCQIFDIINGFWVITQKTGNFTICSIFSNSGHVGWCTASPDTILKLDTLVMIQTHFLSNLDVKLKTRWAITGSWEPLVSSPDPRSGELLPSLVVVVRRKLFQKSSPLKVLDQWKSNLVWIGNRIYLKFAG